MTAFQPVLTILAGPNGSGKTTLFERLNPPGEQVNADRIARLINPIHPEAASAEAARATLVRLSQLVEARQNLSYETTLSGRQPLTLIRGARLAGYRVELAYITLEDVALNLLRVRQRILEGGHSIPEADIIRRYERSLSHLSEATALADEVAVFDNTGAIMELLFQWRAGSGAASALDPSRPYHRRLADALARGTGLDLQEIYLSRW